MGDTSLSSVVSGLVRAQMGTSVSSTVTDEDLDRHVAELILKEAKKKAEQYGKQGISAYLPQPESNVPKPNKRFLSSIIRNTDDHNKSILRAQALSASEIRTERSAQESADRRVRAQEAVTAERERRSVRGRDDSWDRERRRRERSWERYGSDEGEEDRRQPPKRRQRDDDEERVERSHGSRSARRSRRDEEGSSGRHRHRSRTPSDGEEEREKNRRRSRRTSKSRSKSPDGASKRSSRGTTSKRHRSHSPDDEGHLSRRHRRRRHRSGSRSAGHSSSDVDHRSRDKGRSRHHDSSRRHRRRHRSRSRTPDKASRSETLSEGLGVGNRPSGSRSSSQPLLAEDRAGDLARREAELRRKLKGKGKATTEATDERARSRSCTPPVLDTSPTPRGASPKRRRSPSPGPRPPARPPPPLPPPADFSPDSVRPDLPSKMDKYFETSYDPRLDVAPLAAPSIPATGLINNAEFEGWDAMLELIKQRRADKAEQKRLERLGLVEKSGKEKKKSKSKVAGLGVAGMLADWSAGGDGLMDIEYKKRGSVREWDLGKESPT